MSEVTIEFPEEPEKSKRGRKPRKENSREIVAVEKMQMDIETADRLYGDGMMYDRDRVENEIKFYLSQSAQSLFESGKRFNWLKAREGHGGFMASLEHIGVSQTTANYAMAVVNKFGPNSQTFGNLGPSKLQMLTVLEEPDIKILAEGGAVKGVTLDDIDRMSVREVRKTLRTERKGLEKERAAFQQSLLQKDAKINELDMRLNGQEPPAKEQFAEIRLEEFLKPFNTQLQDAIFAMNRCVEKIAEIQRIENISYVQLNAWILKQSEDIENFTESFTELQDAINEIHIDRGDTEEGEAGTDG